MVGADRIIPRAQTGVHPPVNEHDYNSLFAALNEAVEILYRNRTPDADFIAAYDTLKQSRAMIEQALAASAPGSSPGSIRQVAA